MIETPAVRASVALRENAAGDDRAEAKTPRRCKRSVGSLSILAIAVVVLLALAAGLAHRVLPAVSVLDGDLRRGAAGVIFATSYLALAVGRVPGLRIDRAGIALVGAALMVASGALPLDEAYKAVHLDTIRCCSG